MKIFDFFKRFSRGKQKSSAPIRTVRDPRAPHVSRQQAAVEKMQQRKIPDDPFFDTGELQIQSDASSGLDDPYATYTWEMDPVTGLRRIDDSKAVNKKRPKNASSVASDNPYGTMDGRKR
ncbi:MAG: hypothetical protein OEU86_04050 [Gammaproteobacteria bacterium]|nr:hypothetical protein [Gammaproteobacteria bacterium]